MKLLSLETSTKHFSLALSDDKKIAASRNFVLKKVLSSSIIPAIAGILKKKKWTLSDLDGFAVGLGPGSFTSLRVGLATVKALALATGKPLVGVSSLDVLARNVLSMQEIPPSVCTMCDARRNLVYACFYEPAPEGLRRRGDYLLIGLDELLQKIRRPTLLIGDGIPLYRERIAGLNERGPSVVLADEKYWYPQAKHLAVLARERFQNHEFDPPERIVPLYLHPQDCQVQPGPAH